MFLTFSDCQTTTTKNLPLIAGHKYWAKKRNVYINKYIYIHKHFVPTTSSQKQARKSSHQTIHATQHRLHEDDLLVDLGRPPVDSRLRFRTTSLSPFSLLLLGNQGAKHKRSNQEVFGLLELEVRGLFFSCSSWLPVLMDFHTLKSCNGTKTHNLTMSVNFIVKMRTSSIKTHRYLCNDWV